jgi:hypothetical protein
MVGYTPEQIVVDDVTLETGSFDFTAAAEVKNLENDENK